MSQSDNELDVNLQNVIQDGIRFMESLVRCYGQDKGMEMWNALGSAMGKEVQGKILFSMLTGTTSNRVRFRIGNVRLNGKTVAAIKCIRNYTAFGLKEAKDAVDRSDGGISEVTVESGINVSQFTRELRDIGFIVL